jgi:hypothetical protein
MATSSFRYLAKDFHQYDEYVFVVPTLGRFIKVNKTVSGPPAEAGGQVHAGNRQLTLV